MSQLLTQIQMSSGQSLFQRKKLTDSGDSEMQPTLISNRQTCAQQGFLKVIFFLLNNAFNIASVI